VFKVTVLDAKVGPPPDLADARSDEWPEADPVECSYGINLSVQAYIR